MSQRPRERATDNFGIVHEVAMGATWVFVGTACRIASRWRDRATQYADSDTMTWDGFDPLPDVTCMACIAARAKP